MSENQPEIGPRVEEVRLAMEVRALFHRADRIVHSQWEDFRDSARWLEEHYAKSEDPKKVDGDVIAEPRPEGDRERQELARKICVIAALAFCSNPMPIPDGQGNSLEKPGNCEGQETTGPDAGAEEPSTGQAENESGHRSRDCNMGRRAVAQTVRPLKDWAQHVRWALETLDKPPADTSTTACQSAEPERQALSDATLDAWIMANTAKLGATFDWLKGLGDDISVGYADEADDAAGYEEAFRVNAQKIGRDWSDLNYRRVMGMEPLKLEGLKQTLVAAANDLLTEQFRRPMNQNTLDELTWARHVLLVEWLTSEPDSTDDSGEALFPLYRQRRADLDRPLWEWAYKAKDLSDDPKLEASLRRHGEQVAARPHGWAPEPSFYAGAADPPVYQRVSPFWDSAVEEAWRRVHMPIDVPSAIPTPTPQGREHNPLDDDPLAPRDGRSSSTFATSEAAPTVGKGMPWIKACNSAIAHCQRNPFPGVNALAKLVGCSSATIRKAIEHSQYLLKAKDKQGNGRVSVSTVPLNIVDEKSTPQTREEGPEMSAIVDEIFAKLRAQSKTKEQQEKLDNYTPQQRRTIVAAMDEEGLKALDNPL